MGDPLPQGRHRLIVPFVEPASRLDAEIAAIQHRGDRGGVLGARVEIGVQLVNDVRDRVPTGDVEHLQRPRNREPPAEPGLDDRIDVLRRSNALVHDGEGLAEERELHPVADEAERLLLQYDGPLAYAFEDSFSDLDSLVTRLGAAHDLDEGKKVCGIPPVGDRDLVGAVRGSRELAGHVRRRVARQNGVGRAVPIEVGEDTSLEIEVLEHSLDDKSHVVHRAGHRRTRPYASGDGLRGRLVHQSLLLEHSQRCGDVLHRLAEILLGRVGEDDLVAAHGEVHRDAVAHEARADDADASDGVRVHVAIGSVSAHECSRGMLVRQHTAERVTRYNSPMLAERHIILASGSQRRREIIGALDAAVEIVPSGIDERPPYPGENAEEYVRDLSEEKALAVESNGHSETLVIGADTSVVLGEEILGKPVDEADARDMLMALRGRSHRVVTGVTVSCDGTVASSVTSSEVVMREYSDAEMVAYIESDEPFDKAGGYAIQDEWFAPVSTFSGCYLNVVGLPLCEVMRMMSKVGVDAKLKPEWRAPERCPSECPVRLVSEVAVT